MYLRHVVNQNNNWGWMVLFVEVILPKLQLPPSPPSTPPPRTDQPPLPSEYVRKKKKEPPLGNFRPLFVSLVLTQIW